MKTKNVIALSFIFLSLILTAVAIATPGPYLDNKTGSVLDTSSELIWQQGYASAKNWEAALDYCAYLSLDDVYYEWRLPTIKELQSLVKTERNNPAIDTIVFPGTPSGKFWSSSTFTSGITEAWYVDFTMGHASTVVKTNTNYVRCVRTR